jgi:hypothetical protein
MKNIRSRPKGYFLTILQENDHYFIGKEKGLPISSRQYLSLGSTMKEIREKMKEIRLLEGEHLWMGYQPKDNMPSVAEAWVQIYGKKIQYRSRTKKYYDKDNVFHGGVPFESLFPFIGADLRYHMEMDQLGYNFVRDVIARRDLIVDSKRLLCSLSCCDGQTHTDCLGIVKGLQYMESEWGRDLLDKGFHRCYFSTSDEWEYHVKESFPFGVVCYKWGVNENVIEYVKTNLW